MLSRREESPACNTIPNAAKNTISPLFAAGVRTTRTHCFIFQLGFYQDVCRTAFQLGDSQHVLVPGTVPLHMQDLGFLLIEHHEILDSPILQTAQVPLDDSTTLQCSSHSTQFCVTCKFFLSSRSLMKD